MTSIYPLTDPLLGKFFLVETVRTGVVECPIGVGSFLIRFDDPTGSGPLAVVDLEELAGSVDSDGDPPSWLFFDTAEQRAKYQAWLAERRSVRRNSGAGGGV